MPRPHRSNSRRRIGRVTVYYHHGCWWLYYQESDGKKVRRRVGESGALAECQASYLNAKLVATANDLTFPLAGFAAGVGDTQPSNPAETARQRLPVDEL